MNVYNPCSVVSEPFLDVLLPSTGGGLLLDDAILPAFPHALPVDLQAINHGAHLPDVPSQLLLQAFPQGASSPDTSSVNEAPRRAPQRRRGASPVRRHSFSDTDDPSVALQREKIKETNRRAQRRYRDRQREKLAEAEARVADLSQQLHQLHMEKDAISASHAMLQRCAEMQRAQSAAGATSIIQGESDAWWIDDKTRVEIATLGSEDELTFTVCPGAHLHLTRQQVTDMPLAEAATLWRAYLAAFTQLLSEMAGDPDSAAGRRLARLYYETLQLWGALMSSKPDRAATVMRQLLADEERDSMHALDHDAEDRRLAAAAAFTAEQRAALCGLRERLLVNLGALQRRREALTAQLQAALPRVDASPSPRGSFDSDSTGSTHRRSSSSADDRYGSTLAAMEALRESLRQEHCCYLQGGFLFWRRLLVPSQGAQLNVLAYPHDLRVFGVADCIALDMGQPSAAELLARGAAQADAPLLQLDEALPPGMRTITIPPVGAGMGME